ncbi:MAG: shikimate kinase [Demequinaceae bacterium]|nr:shikimate kinase [Demequinaceae bacterium]
MPRVVIIGPPGSGKSTVAAALAAQWGIEALDTDDEIVARAGKDIPSIFVEDGESAFRALEREVVASCLTGHDGILALGGGAILDPETQGDLERYAQAGGEVVYLSVGATAAASRVGITGSRPLLKGDVHRRWVALMEERRGIYERLATRIVPTDEAAPDVVAQAIAAEVGAG